MFLSETYLDIYPADVYVGDYRWKVKFLTLVMEGVVDSFYFGRKKSELNKFSLHQITLMFRLWNQQARYGDLVASMGNQDGKINTKPGID
jgi:hypothetical protein